ncbi:MAG: hypothetical protein AAGD07_01305 [Planctomycetota bacterium]
MVPQPPLHDPQEFLCDGGDHAPEARLSLNGQFLGLQAEDTITHYTTEAGDIELSASNRVCLYAPRFGSVRQITGAVSGGNAIGVVKVDRPVGPRSVDLDLPGLTVRDSLEVVQTDQVRRVDAMRDRNRGVRLERVQQPQLAADVWAALASIRNIGLGQLEDAELALLQRQSLAAVAWSMDESVEVEILDLAPPVLTRDQSVQELYVYDFPDAGRLNLMKFADKHDAAPGEEVGFLLRLQNVGDSSVSNIRITDNLTTRLAYIAESQECSVDAEFEESNNAQGSKQLTWTLLEPMEVGDVVTIRFTTTVR